MKKNRKMIREILVLVFLYAFFQTSCSNANNNSYKDNLDQKSNESLHNNDIKKDSCENILCYLTSKKDIPLNILKKTTIIDPVYYVDNSSFSSDTLINLDEEYGIGVIDYNDGVACSYKFVLIVNLKTGKNTDYILAQSDCDRDGENEYYFYSYKVVGKEITVLKKHVPKGSEMDKASIIEQKKYKINNEGKAK